MLAVKGCIHRQRPSKSIESHIIIDARAIAGFIDTITAVAARSHSTITLIFLFMSENDWNNRRVYITDNIANMIVKWKNALNVSSI